MINLISLIKRTRLRHEDPPSPMLSRAFSAIQSTDSMTSSLWPASITALTALSTPTLLKSSTLHVHPEQPQLAHAQAVQRLVKHLRAPDHRGSSTYALQGRVPSAVREEAADRWVGQDLLLRGPGHDQPSKGMTCRCSPSRAIAPVNGLRRGQPDFRSWRTGPMTWNKLLSTRYYNIWEIYL